MTERVDAVIVGGGIAGVSAAAFLAPSMTVRLVDMEATLAHHTTGRSAAQYIENYGSETIRRLTIAGRPFFENPPAEPLWSPRSAMMVGRADQRDRVEAAVAEGRRLVDSIRLLEADEVREMCPALREDFAGCGSLEPDAMDLDVHGIHQTFLRQARADGAVISPEVAVTGLRAQPGGWRVTTTAGDIDAAVVVNASGAWGDVVAAMAGVDPIGIRPLRRTAFTVAVPERFNGAGWPLVHDIDEAFYFKPEGVDLLCSPADETLSEPCDARPEEIDIARTIDHLNSVTTLDIRSVRSSWAGLRTFTVDRNPAVGFDPDHPGFFWLVGQGGYGIQTAPALGQLCAAEITGADLPAAFTTEAMGAAIASMDPARFRTATEANRSGG